MTFVRRPLPFVQHLLTAGLFTLSVAVFAQQPAKPAKPVREGEIDNQEITVEKSRKIELPPPTGFLPKYRPLKPPGSSVN